jgi:septal ring factor EnvC (AmiA/AmiB activator)
MESYTHILQKTGVLKTFTVAKVVNKQEIEDLKTLIKSVASDEAEYKTMLAEELAKISNMHDHTNPIPGIIYGGDDVAKKKILFAITTKFAQNIKQQKFDKKDLAFLMSAIINELGLTQEDFQNLKEELEEDEDEEDEEDSENQSF